MNGVSLAKTAVVLITCTLLLGTPGCIGYWNDVDKLQQENFELEDQLKWQTRDQEMKAKNAAEAPPSDAPVKPSDY